MKTEKELKAIRTVLTKRADELCKEHEKALAQINDEMTLHEQMCALKNAIPVGTNICSLRQQAALITFLLE